MTDPTIPEMVPSAEERERDWKDRAALFHDHQTVAELMQDAFCDGVLAERERLLAALREPSANLIRIAADARVTLQMHNQGMAGKVGNWIAITILRAAANWLEKHDA